MTRPAPRRPSPRLDVERRNQLLVVALGVGVVVVALGIALFGYYQTNVAPKGDPVLQVEDRSFSLGYFERRVRYEVRNGNTTLLSDATRAVDMLISMVRREELLRRGAIEQGILFSEEDIDDEIRDRLAVPKEVDRSVFAEVYRGAVRESGLATRDYRDLIASSLAEIRLREKFQAQVPAKTEQVRYRIILVATVEAAQSVLDRLNAGEDFAVLARDLSLDASSKDSGGEYPWTARASLEKALDEALFSLQPGQRSGVIEIGAGAGVVEVLERGTDRDTAPEQRAAVGNRAFDDWLQELQDRTRILTFLDAEQTNAILEALLHAVEHQA